jgi:predicted small secreted protein
MKKIFTIALVLTLVFSFAACNGKKGGGNTSGGRSVSGSFAGAEEAGDKLEQWARAQGWDENSYGNYIYGVWDSGVLPGCVPKEIPGVKVEQTTYKEKRHDVYSQNYHVGAMEFPNRGYEEWGVSFDCTKTQLNAFIAAMEANGFYGGQVEVSNYSPAWAWAGNGYYAYLYLNAQAADDEYDAGFASFDITQANQLPRPKSFSGTKLPDAGVVLGDYSEGVGYGWDSKTNDTVEYFWNPYTDKGTLPDDWYVWFDYFGATIAEGKAYTKNMVSQGWEIAYENEWNNEWDTFNTLCYTAQLKKGDLHAAVSVNDYGYYNMAVRFGTMSDALYY